MISPAGSAHPAAASTPRQTGEPQAAIIDAISGADHAPDPALRSAIDRALDLARLGVAHLGAVESTLVPTYRRAVAATDTAAVKAIALQIVGGVARIIDAQAHIERLVPEANTTPNAVRSSTPESDPFSSDPAELAPLIRIKAELDLALTTTVPTLAVQVSPQIFGDQPVAGLIEPPPTTREPLGYLAYESGLVIQLLEEADLIQSLISPSNPTQATSEPASDVGQRDAIDHLERWKSRPINFLFLVRVLTQRGAWQRMQGVESLRGHTADDLAKKVTAQTKETGTTADVGSLWDVDGAKDALTYGPTDWAVTDANALDVFDMLAKAEPRARAGLIKQLQRMGLLGRLCDNLPWGLVKQSGSPSMTVKRRACSSHTSPTRVAAGRWARCSRIRTIGTQMPSIHSSISVRSVRSTRSTRPTTRAKRG